MGVFLDNVKAPCNKKVVGSSSFTWIVFAIRTNLSIASQSRNSMIGDWKMR